MSKAAARAPTTPAPVTRKVAKTRAQPVGDLSFVPEKWREAARAHDARIDAETHEYLRVRMTGVFLHDRETLVQALTARGAGYWVMTPMETTDGIMCW